MALLATLPLYINKSGQLTETDVLVNLKRISRTIGYLDSFFDYNEEDRTTHWHADVPLAILNYAISRNDDMRISINYVKRNGREKSGTLLLNTQDVIYGYAYGNYTNLIVWEGGEKVRYLVAHTLDQLMYMSLDVSSVAGQCYIQGNYLYMTSGIHVMGSYATGDTRQSWSNNGILIETFDGTKWATTQQQI